MKKVTISIALCALIIVACVSVKNVQACGHWYDDSCDSASGVQQTTQETVAQEVSNLTNSVPIPTLSTSLERQNISNRLQLFSVPTKISYIYLISYGKVMAFYTVKGKITSGSKRLTPNQEQVDSNDCSGNGNCDLVMDAPELDGTYGSSGDYIYFWTTSGAYVQWNGEYMLADQPLQLTTPPELVQSVSK